MTTAVSFGFSGAVKNETRSTNYEVYAGPEIKQLFFSHQDKPSDMSSARQVEGKAGGDCDDHRGQDVDIFFEHA